mmetsp:Transcript_15335/g.29733  ORF Transcript_15335/g.29733 Transcript_15335/m.29733 type:complete len:437 (+) Transcript_15335:122-1432(+)
METNRALLDELMGAERNLAPEQRTNRRRRHFSDPEVDKMYLVGCSPYELFKGTKSDYFGPNPKIVDDTCKEEWEKLSEHEKRRYGYEEDTRKFLMDMVRKVDNRISDNLARIKNEAPDDIQANARKVVQLEDEMEELLKNLQALAEKGEVLMAFDLYKRVENLRAQRDKLYVVPDAQRRHLVCPISGNLILRSDSDERLLSHFTGKQYNGWKLVRAKLKELNEKLSSRPADVYDRVPPRQTYPISRSHGSAGRGGSSLPFGGRSVAYSHHNDRSSRFSRDHSQSSSYHKTRDRSRDRASRSGSNYERNNRDDDRSRLPSSHYRRDKYGSGRDRSLSRDREQERYHRKRGRDDEYDYDFVDRQGKYDSDRDSSSNNNKKKKHKKEKKKKSHKSHKLHSSSRRRYSDSESDSDAEIERRIRGHKSSSRSSRRSRSRSR